MVKIIYLMVKGKQQRFSQKNSESKNLDLDIIKILPSKNLPPSKSLLMELKMIHLIWNEKVCSFARKKYIQTHNPRVRTDVIWQIFKEMWVYVGV